MNPGIGDRGKVDKNCMAADVAVFKCHKPIDAANYIGIAYDYTKGVNRDTGETVPQGFRGKIVKHWCRDQQNYKGALEVPDGMHVQGVYETTTTTTVRIVKIFC